MFKAIYATKLWKDGGWTGKIIESIPFASLEQAKNKAHFPPNCEFALISTGDGHHVYSRIFGWEFHDRL